MSIEQYFSNKHIFVLLVGGAAALLVGAGCGGNDSSQGSGDGASTTAIATVEVGSLSKAAFIKRADAMCESARARFGREYEDFLRKKGAASSPEKQATLLPEAIETLLIPDFEKAIGEVASLGAPRNDQEEVTSFLGAMQEGFKKMRERESVSYANTYFSRAISLGTQYGLTGCVQSLS